MNNIETAIIIAGYE